MSSRYPPPGESRHRDRERSPYRFERRGSITSGPINSYRPGDSNSNVHDVLGAPRGPSGRGSSYSTRGGNYISREGRGGRDAQFYRRDSDRDFTRRDNDRRPSPSRNRSRTPPSTRDFRDRENRDAPFRSLDMTRVTRETRENGPLSAVSASSEAGSSGGNHHRNSFRSTRGRGDWDRGQNRRTFDDSFRPRSRSRDRWDRDHDRGRDHDRDNRRDDDIRDRDGDRGRRDPPVRPDSRNSVASQPISVGGSVQNERKDPPKPPQFVETPRRASFVQTPARPDLSRRPSTTQTPSSPVQCPQVPEFGVIKTAVTPTDTPRSAPGPSPKDEISPAFKSENSDPTKIAPRGPRADLAAVPPTAPKGFGRRPGFPDQSPATRRFDANHDTSSVASPVAPRFGPSASPPFAHASIGRTRNPTWTSPDLVAKSAQGPTTNMETRTQPENEVHRPTDIKIPTGPRADRDISVRTPLSARSTKPAAMIWVNPNRQQPQQHKPSIMQSMHSRKDDEHSSRPSASSPISDMRPRLGSITDGEAARRASSDMTSARRSILSPGSIASAIQGFRGKDPDEDDNADAMDDEDEDDEDDEDNAELDQQDLERSETKYKKQIESLRKKLAPEPSMNPKIRAALESIQIYASAIEDYKNGYVPPPKSIAKEKPRGTAVLSPTLGQRPSDIPTPPAETTPIKNEDDKVIVEEFIDLPLDGLIYLNKNRLTPVSFDFNDTEAEEDDLCVRVRHTLIMDSKEDEELKEEYAERYLKWREEVDAIDEENAQQEALMTRAATPMSVLGTETATTPVPESGRRSTRNATEMDLERVIKESAEEAQAAEIAQLPVDMSVEPDMTREADIPDMLTEEDQEIFMFEDLNNRVPNISDIMTTAAPEDNPVFKAYDYLPPPDDFDPDDQERFMDAYAKFPKQWGFLAKNMNEAAMQAEIKDENQALPKIRDYHQCILHYYMTKKQAKPAYKLLPNRKGRAKKKNAGAGRRGNQRSSMLGGGEEGGTRISDTGRPKRAAAPSFNDKEKREAEVLAQKAAMKEKKASTLLNKPVVEGTSGSEKTPKGKRKKGEKPAKRGAKTAGPAPNILPAQNGEQGTAGNVQMQNAYGSQDLEGARLLAELHGYAGGSNTSQPSTKGAQNETWRVDTRIQGPSQPSQMLGATSMGLQSAGMSMLDSNMMQRALSASGKENVFPIRQLSPSVVNQQTGPNAGQTTTSTNGRPQEKTSSYWSVSESNLFEQALKQHGRDWSTIASLLPQKTETMCENFFKKGGKFSNDPESKLKYEEIADEAEMRILKEGPPPPLEPLPRTQPQLASSSRRRGAPSSQRAIAPTPDPSAEVVAPISASVDAQGIPNPTHMQGAPQNPSLPRNVPARQVSASLSAASEILSTTKVPIPPQAARTQPNTIQTQSHTSPYAPHLDLDRPRNVAPPSHEPIHSLQMSQSKRPRSISDDIHIQEQKPKRQGVISSEEFTKHLTLQHQQEQQQQQTQHVQQQQQQMQQQQQQYVQQQQAHPQHMQQQPPQIQPQSQQQRNLHRSDSQQGYDYRQSATQNAYPPSVRTASANNESDRYRRPPSPREREVYAAVQQYRQDIPAGTNSMASVMNGVRGYEHSPRQHPQTELPRPSSIAPATTNRSTPAPASAAPQKRSNIMSLLNNDPPEEKKITESRPVQPARYEPPMTNTNIHQPTPQPMYPRREVIDPPRESLAQHAYGQSTYAAPTTQSQSYNNQQSQPYMHPSQHQHPPRDYQQRPYYPEPGRSHEAPRPMYQSSSSAISPPPAQESSYRVPRPNYDTPSHVQHGPTSSHSRAASYSMHPDSSVAGPSQALGPSPSPYKSIRPSNPPQPMSHPQHPVYHPTNQGPGNMAGIFRAATSYPGQLGHEHRRVEDQRMYGTPSHTPPNNYGSYPPPPTS